MHSVVSVGPLVLLLTGGIRVEGGCCLGMRMGTGVARVYPGEIITGDEPPVISHGRLALGYPPFGVEIT